MGFTSDLLCGFEISLCLDYLAQGLTVVCMLVDVND